MATLSDKYVAGFFDADGSVNVVFHADCRTPQLRVSFSQATLQDEVLHRIHAEWGGCISYVIVKGASYTHLTYSGNRQCSLLLNRIRKFSVIKRHYIDVCLDVCSRRIEREEIPRVREYLKIQRKQRALPLPKHPTRKWLAGYIDGDGCISATTIRKPFGQVAMVLHIAASNFDTEGIEVIQNTFGGAIHDMCEGRVKQLVISLQASKINEIFSEIVEHMIVKQDQAKIILKCAAMGHLRDGENIKAALKHLKAHPHRLNEPKPDLEALVKTIRDLPAQRLTPEQYSERSRKTWVTRRAMRQSETVSR
jgi:LAGLIDADG endonuclease